MNPMESKPGTYILVLRSQIGARAKIGRLGYLAVEPGYYLYTGSAFGPGGA
jgi:Uri superfamily endonuclease